LQVQLLPLPQNNDPAPAGFYHFRAGENDIFGWLEMIKQNE
jgi:hypothetical protein